MILKTMTNQKMITVILAMMKIIRVLVMMIVRKVWS